MPCKSKRFRRIIPPKSDSDDDETDEGSGTNTTYNSTDSNQHVTDDSETDSLMQSGRDRDSDENQYSSDRSSGNDINDAGELINSYR